MHGLDRCWPYSCMLAATPTAEVHSQLEGLLMYAACSYASFQLATGSQAGMKQPRVPRAAHHKEELLPPKAVSSEEGDVGGQVIAGSQNEGRHQGQGRACQHVDMCQGSVQAKINTAFSKPAGQLPGAQASNWTWHAACCW